MSDNIGNRRKINENANNESYLNLSDDTAFYKDIDGKLYENTDAVSDGKNIWDTTSCVITDISNTGFTATVPYLDLYEAHRSAKLEFVLDSAHIRSTAGK